MNIESAHLDIKNTMPLVFLVLVISVAALAALARHLAARQQQAQGLIWLQAVRVLLSHVQKHRGLSSGVLSGDRSLNGLLKNTQEQVSCDFNHIAEVGEWVKLHQGWESITQHWARLAGNVNSLPPARAIDQHNRLIKNILVFVDDIASAHHLAAHSSSRTNMWRELLTLAEVVGQLRAAGTSLVASGGRAGFELVQQNIEGLSCTVIDMLEAPRCRNNLNPINLQNILTLLEYIDDKLLQQEPTVSTKEYYGVVTETLDQLYEQFDSELNKLSRRLAR